MYYVWQQRLYSCLLTTDGLPIEVLHPGLRNRELGPDFFNAKVRYDGILWAGNVEMHMRASDWYRHHHQTNPAYGSVILHVVLEADEQIHLTDGQELRTVVMQIPPEVMRRYYDLCGQTDEAKDGQSDDLKTSGSEEALDGQMPLLPGQTPAYVLPSCRKRLTSVPSLIVHDWINALAIARMTGKMQRVTDRVKLDMKSWEEGFYTIMLRSLGTGTNGDAMERLARSLPYAHLLHHRDDLLQLRAMLLGQAGLITSQLNDYELMIREYDFLRNKFNLTPLEPALWKLSRLRPQASPQVRLQAFASLMNRHANLFAELLEAQTIAQLQTLLSAPGLGKQTIMLLLINAVVPALLSYHQWQGDEERCEQILTLLEQLPAEQNRYISQWTEAGISARSALDSQALLHLMLHYCQPHKCMQCRIGCWLIRH